MPTMGKPTNEKKRLHAGLPLRAGRKARDIAEGMVKGVFEKAPDLAARVLKTGQKVKKKITKVHNAGKAGFSEAAVVAFPIVARNVAVPAAGACAAMGASSTFWMTLPTASPSTILQASTHGGVVAGTVGSVGAVLSLTGAAGVAGYGAKAGVELLFSSEDDKKQTEEEEQPGDEKN